ncbi:MAG: hypothetical protein CMG04_05070 [Candidatus Marinimicrobia bacterium]|nr:hypothetical protein [Candidatus Neomarinimicrobiota bacterium]|tara:strand:- start:2951 stop:3298 length:348 start_codon:yes stop_codon:yes gene_type:complete
MIQYFISGGIFMIPIYLSFFLLIFITSKNLKSAYHIDKIILTGSISSIFGIIATGFGISNALSIVPDISRISSNILWNGLKTSLATTFSGGFILLFSTVLWLFFSRKYKPQLQDH